MKKGIKDEWCIIFVFIVFIFIVVVIGGFPSAGFNQQMRIEHNKSIRFDVVDIPITAEPLITIDQK